MKTTNSILLSLTVCALTHTAAAQLTVGQALANYDNLIQNYNLISFGNTKLTSIGDSEGGLAIGGNLTVTGTTDIATQPAAFGLGTNPTLYVKGTITTTNTNDVIRLQSGHAALPGANAAWNWGTASNNLGTNSDVVFTSINSSSTTADIDPRSNSLDPQWDWSVIEKKFRKISTTLSNAAPTSSAFVDNSGSLVFNAPYANPFNDVTIVNFDANLLSGNTYNGAAFSNVRLDVPGNASFVINVFNADNRTLFGSGAGINFNVGTNDNRVLWNIVGANAATDLDVVFGNGGQFYGSILAPNFKVSNDGQTNINGQVVAKTFDYSCRELHYTGFDDIPPVPEPSTYGLLGAAALLIGVVAKRKPRKA